jgi:hypothetical protein
MNKKVVRQERIVELMMSKLTPSTYISGRRED